MLQYSSESYQSVDRIMLQPLIFWDNQFPWFFHCLEFQFLHCFSQATSFSVQRQQFSIFCSLLSYSAFSLISGCPFLPLLQTYSSFRVVLTLLSWVLELCMRDQSVLYRNNHRFQEPPRRSLQSPLLPPHFHMVSQEVTFSQIPGNWILTFSFSFLSNSRKHDFL